MKKFVAIPVVAAAIIGTGLFWLSGNIDGSIKDTIADYGSAMTKASVSIGAVKVTPANGKVTIGDLQIGNPQGFKTAYALKASRIDVDIDIASVTSDVIHVHRVAIVAPDVIYEKGEAMTNFDAIQKNIANYLGSTENNNQGKKLLVDELTIRDARDQASAAFMNGKTVNVSLPDITLKNLGKAKKGITPSELGQEVAGALKAKVIGAFSSNRLMNSTGKALDKAGTAIKGLFK